MKKWMRFGEVAARLDEQWLATYLQMFGYLHHDDFTPTPVAYKDKAVKVRDDDYVWHIKRVRDRMEQMRKEFRKCLKECGPDGKPYDV